MRSAIVLIPLFFKDASSVIILQVFHSHFEFFSVVSVSFVCSNITHIVCVYVAVDNIISRKH
jgi:hypothetical protein